MADTITHLLAIAQDAALQAGKIIMEIYHSGHFGPDVPSTEFPDTLADKSAHRIIAQQLEQTNLPVLSEEGRNIDFKKRNNWDYFWMIDPLDGTKEFLHKNGEFSVNIALIKHHLPIAGVVYIPCNESMFVGSTETGVYKNENGNIVPFSPLLKRNHFNDLFRKKQVRIIVSRSHPSKETNDFIKQFSEVEIISLGSALKFMWLLENKADVYPRLGPTMEWDTAAAHAILNASNRGVYHPDLKSELHYNKPGLKNPPFIAF